MHIHKSWEQTWADGSEKIIIILHVLKIVNSKGKMQVSGLTKYVYTLLLMHYNMVAHNDKCYMCIFRYGGKVLY